MSGVYTTDDINKFRSIFFNNKNSMTDMDLVMIGNTPVSAVAPKLVDEEIAYSNGSLSLSRADGTLYFEDRNITYSFVFLSQITNTQSALTKNINVTDKIRAVNEWLYDYAGLMNNVSSWTATYGGNSYTMDRDDLLDTGYSRKFVNARVESVEVSKGIFNECWIDQINVTFKAAPEMLKRNVVNVDIVTFGDRTVTGRYFTGSESWGSNPPRVKKQTMMNVYNIYGKNGLSEVKRTYWMNDFAARIWKDELSPTGYWRYEIDVPYDDKIGMYIDPTAYDPNTGRTYAITSVTAGSGGNPLYFIDNDAETPYSTTTTSTKTESHNWAGGYLYTTPKLYNGRRIVALQVSIDDNTINHSSPESQWPRIYFEWGPLIDIPRPDITTAGESISWWAKCFGVHNTNNDVTVEVNNSITYDGAFDKALISFFDQPITTINCRSKNFNKLWKVSINEPNWSDLSWKGL